MPEAMSEFLTMGGFAEFVWPAWIVVIGLMVGVVLSSMWSLRRQQTLLRRLEQPSEGP